MVPDTFNILALCAGGGGLELGIELVLPCARTVCVVEIEAFACEVLAEAHENLGVGAPVGWTDVRTFDGRPWRGCVDCVAAGYPCQPFSVAGRRRGADDPRHLWPDVRRIVGEVRPAFVFLENVAGHVRLGLREVRRDLERMGYVVEAGLFEAAEVGATHQRQRLFILAYAINNGLQREPIAREDASPARPATRGPQDSPRMGRNSLADAARLCEPRPLREDRRGGAGRADAEPERDARDGPVGEPELPLFPPGPGDLDAWRKVLGINPLLEPAIYGRLNPVFVEALMNWPAHFTDTRRPRDASDFRQWLKRTRQVLRFLCCSVGPQAIRKEIGGPGSIPSQKVLQPAVYGTRNVHSVPDAERMGGARPETKKGALRTLRHNGSPVHSSQKQEVVGQSTGEHLYALRILSHYFAPLKRRYCSEKEMASMSPLWVLDLWAECLQHLPDADQTRWRAASRDHQEATVIAAAEAIIRADRTDRLSMLGNGVLPVQAAYAFATLLARLEQRGGPEGGGLA